MKILLVTLLLTGTVINNSAWSGTYTQAERIRHRISLNMAHVPSDIGVERIRLPISPGISQEDSDLCWVYATLSLLETSYLVQHPLATGVQFSRAAMQYNTIQDRFIRWIRGEQNLMVDGGIAVDALDLIRRNGLIQFDDYHDIVTSPPIYSAIRADLARQSTVDQKMIALNVDLKHYLKAQPEKTHIGSITLTPADLALEVLKNRQWVEFDLSTDGFEGWGPSKDPEARLSSLVYYTSLDTLITQIRNSLRAGESVVWGTVDHAMLIYGADYDPSGKPLVYYVKDSYPPFTYKASAADLHRELTDVTVVRKSGD